MKSQFLDEQEQDRIRAERLATAVDRWINDIPKMDIRPETVGTDIASIETRLMNFESEIASLTGCPDDAEPVDYFSDETYRL